MGKKKILDKQFVISSDGKKHEIVRTDEKYIYCKDTQFKKTNADIKFFAEAKEIEDDVKKAEDSEEEE